MGTLCEMTVVVGFKKGPQYLLNKMPLAVLQMFDDPKKGCNFMNRISLEAF